MTIETEVATILRKRFGTYDERPRFREVDGYFEDHSSDRPVRWGVEITETVPNNLRIRMLWGRCEPLVREDIIDRLLIVTTEPLTPGPQHFIQRVPAILHVTLRELASVTLGALNDLGRAAHSGTTITIQKRLSERPAELATMALSLSRAFAEQISNWEQVKPNEPDALTVHERNVQLLRTVAEGLDEIGRALADYEDTKAIAKKRNEISRAAKAATVLGSDITNWFETHSRQSVNYVMNTGLLGAGVAYLSICGVPSIVGLVPLAALLSGKSLFDGVRLLPTKIVGNLGSDKPSSKKKAVG